MSRCNFNGWGDVLGEVPRCLTVQTTVRHEAELEDDSLGHIQPVQFVMKKSRQTTIKLLRVTGYSGGGVEHSLQLIRDRLRSCSCTDSVALNQSVTSRKNAQELLLIVHRMRQNMLLEG